MNNLLWASLRTYEKNEDGMITVEDAYSVAEKYATDRAIETLEKFKRDYSDETIYSNTRASEKGYTYLHAALDEAIAELKGGK